MGERMTLTAENITIGTGRVLVAFQTAAAAARGQQARITHVRIGAQIGVTTLAAIRGELATRDIAGTLTVTSKAPVSTYDGGTVPYSGNTALGTGTARSGVASSADSGGTYVSGPGFSFPNLQGFLWKPDRDEEIIIPPTRIFVVRFLADPATTTGWTCEVGIESFG